MSNRLFRARPAGSGAREVAVVRVGGKTKTPMGVNPWALERLRLKDLLLRRHLHQFRVFSLA